MAGSTGVQSLAPNKVLLQQSIACGAECFHFLRLPQDHDGSSRRPMGGVSLEDPLQPFDSPAGVLSLSMPISERAFNHDFSA